MDSRRLPIGIRWIAVLLLACAHGAVMAQGAWHLDRIDEFQAPRFNSPEAPDNGRDPYCPGHRIDIGPGRDSQNFVITQVIPGSCHNRGGYRGVFSYRHFWTAPPARLLAGRQMPFRLGSKVVTVENAPFGTGASGVMAGFLDYDQANGPYGPGSNEPGYKIASIAAEGPPDTEASFDNERSERPFVMPPHPAFGSDRNDGRIRFRIWTSHVYPWRAVDYVYHWVGDGADQAILNTSPKGESVGYGSPIATPDRLNVSGTWTVVFNGRTTTTLMLQQNNSAVSGTLKTTDGSRGTVSGQLNGNVLTLSRDTGLDTIQRYQVTVRGNTFSGIFRNEGKYPDEGSFTGRLDAGQVDKSNAGAPNLLGTWNWTCCRGKHRDTFTITEHRADGTIRGVFGSSQDGNSTPLQGTFKAGVMQFTRFLDIAGRKETQEWRARIQVQGGVTETVDGRWSGFAATADNNDFHARLSKGQSTSGAGAVNLARGKPASQSSTSEWSRRDDAQGAVDGIINGSYAFHTGNQANPWWQVDLGVQASIDEVRIFNRLDCCAERARTLQVMLSEDGRQWRTVYRHGGDLFGGRDGKPLKVALRGASARFVRLQLNEANWFHLDEVEVYGRMEDSISMPGGRDYTGYETPQTSQSSTSPSSGNAQVDSATKEFDGLLDAVKSLKGLFGK